MKRLLLLFAVFCNLALAPKVGAAPEITKLCGNGDDGQRLVLAILGDGYAQADQTKYDQDVDHLIISGLLTHDFYQRNRSAFNVYRVRLVSRDSGVSTPMSPKDTALGMIYSGDWDRCWIEESPATDPSVTAAIQNLKKCDFVLILLNESGWGGCSRGMRLAVTSGIDWDVVAHEYGHSIGGLYDEYGKAGVTYTNAEPVNSRNVSSVTSRTEVVWASFIEPTTPIPTDGTNQTVGMFEGAYYCEKGVYRPTFDCRMRSNTPFFCPVCALLMQTEVNPYLKGPMFAAQEHSGTEARSGAGAPEPRAERPGPSAAADLHPGAGTGGKGASPEPRYLQMLIKLSDDGTTQVLKASELPGAVVLRQKPMGAFVYELSTTEKSLVAEALPEDPFVERSVADRGGLMGHHFGHTKTATVVVRVPNTGIDTLPAGDLRLRLFKLEPSAKVETISATNLLKLSAQRAMRMQYDFSRPDLRRQVMDKFNDR